MTEDCILIRKLRVDGTLGIEAEERRKTQQIVVSIELYGNFRDAARSDRIEDCVDYQTVVQRVIAQIQASRRYTVEALATDLARTLCENKRITRVRVRLEKPQAIAECESVGIEIERRPTDFAE